MRIEYQLTSRRKRVSRMRAMRSRSPRSRRERISHASACASPITVEPTNVHPRLMAICRRATGGRATM